MRITVATELQEIGIKVADQIEALLKEKPNAVLGLATGSSPLAVYDELARRYEAGQISFAHARAFTLDEYVGLPVDHPESYWSVIHRDFVSRVDFAPGAVQGPDGNTNDPAQAGADYERAIVEAGGVDFQILGVGSNGHIAFNEPGSSKDSRTRLVPLTEQTRLDNSRFFENQLEDVPLEAMSQGLATILDARALAFIALGSNKAAAVRELVEGEVTSEWPVTLLQQHENLAVYLDEAAAKLLTTKANIN